MDQEILKYQSRRKKQFLLGSLWLVLVTSTIPNFLPVIFPDQPLAIKALILGVWYILFPVGLLIIDNRIFISWDIDNGSRVLWNWLSNFLILLIFWIIFSIFCFHLSFEFSKDLCLITNSDNDPDNKQLGIYKQCLKDAQQNRFKPFL
jgi:hypothetical protein